MYHLPLLLAALALKANANLLQVDTMHPSTYLASVCAPTDPNGQRNLSYPCNAAHLLAAECIYGPDHDGLSVTHSHITNSTTEHMHRPLSGEYQRACVCQSDLFDLLQGCGNCKAAHGGGAVPLAYPGEKCFARVSSAYCRPSNNPTLNFSSFFQEWTVGENELPRLKSRLAAASTSSFTDPIGKTATAVSLYYKASVIGSKEWQVPDFMTESSTTTRSKAISATSTHSRSGSLIVTARSSLLGSVFTMRNGSIVGTGGKIAS